MRFKNFILLFFFVSSVSVRAAAGIIDSLSIGHKKSIVFFPAITESPETSWGFGGLVSYFFKTKKKDAHLRTSNLNAIALYTLKKQTVAGISGDVFFPNENYILKNYFSYSYFPDIFWGIGNNTTNSNAEKYIYRQFYFHPQLLKKIYNQFFIGVSYELQHIIDFDYQPGGLFDQENVLGRGDLTTTSGFGIVAAFDNRNKAFDPTKGQFIQISYANFGRIFGSSFNYYNYLIDVRKYVKTYKEQVFAAQFLCNLNNGNIPFRSLASLGGSNIMRGFYDGRFKDNNMVALQEEYRVPVWWRFGVVGFFGAGEVSHTFSEISNYQLKYAIGGGIRYAISKSEKLNMRLDYGITQEEQGVFYFNIDEAF